MNHYKIDFENGEILRVGFGEPAQNDVIVREVNEFMEEQKRFGWKLLKINGPASLPVAFVLAHALGHLYEEIGVYDPKLNKYVNCISPGGEHNVGDLVN